MIILILNCYSRNSLCVINSLNKEYKLFGATAKRAKHSIKYHNILKSSRLSKIFRYSNPDKNIEFFSQDVIEIIKENKIDVVIATGTNITNYLSKIKNNIHLATEAKVLIEEFEKIQLISDKWSAANLCKMLKLKFPKTMLIESKETYNSIINNFAFPIIIKPRNSYASKGIKIFKDEKSFSKFFKDSKIKGFFDKYIVQEIILGELHDGCYFCNNGEIKACLTQRRLLTCYDFGGSGAINITTKEDTIIRIGESVIKHLNWNGILEIDFIKTSSGDIYILEFNPKIWGTIDLTVKAGLNFPQYLIDTFVLNNQTKIPTKYRINLLYKWILPECIFYWFTKPLWKMPQRMKNTFKRYNSDYAINNLKKENMTHLLGMIFERKL